MAAVLKLGWPDAMNTSNSWTTLSASIPLNAPTARW
jgi:hypothetical protein